MPAGALRRAGRLRRSARVTKRRLAIGTAAGVSFNLMVEHASSLDLTYSALAHPVRRALLELLRPGERRVTDLAGRFELTLAATSKHLQVLERASLIERRISGRNHLLSAVPEPLTAARDWIDHYRAFWEARLDVLEERLRGGRPRP